MAATAHVVPAAPIARLAAEGWHHAGLLISGTVCLLCNSFADATLTKTGGTVLDMLPEAASGRWQALDVTLYKLAGCLVVIAVTKNLGAFLMRLAGERLTARARKDLFFSLLHQPVATFDETSTGELISVLFAEVHAVMVAVTDDLPDMVRELATCVFSAIGMVNISLRFTLIAASVGPLIGLIATLAGGPVSRLALEHQRQLSVTNALASESLSSVRTIKAFGQEAAVSAQLGVEVDECASRALREMALHKVWNASNLLMAGCAVILILRQTGSALERGELTAGGLAAFGMLGVSTGTSANEALKLWASARANAAKGAHALALLDSASAKAADKVAADQCVSALGAVSEANACRSTDGGVAVAFENVSFTYTLVGLGSSGPGGGQGGAALDGVSFTAAAGRTTALCGPSGCGKSTCLSLLLRFYSPTGGTVRLSGVDVHTLPNAWLRTHVAVVPQEPTLFRGTIMQNIMFGASEQARTDWSAEQLRREATVAAISADAHAFILQQPRGYETPVGERGGSLSGGQRQRIAISRALLRDPSVLLLDEATAALDNESERAVQTSLCAAGRRATIIVIAHRLSTIQEADLIVVLQGGRVAERGTHESLSARGGLYSRLATAAEG